jgi:hypothetical protein
MSSSTYDSQAETVITTAARFREANPYCLPGSPVLRCEWTVSSSVPSRSS